MAKLRFRDLVISHLPSCSPSLHRVLLHGFPATMRALTSVEPLQPTSPVAKFAPLRRAIRHPGAWAFVHAASPTANPHDASSTSFTRQFSLLLSFDLPTSPSPTTALPFRHGRFNTLLHRRDLPRLSPRADRSGRREGRRAVKGSDTPRSLPDRLGRVEFTCVTDWSFVSGCSPPFLVETQLPLSTSGR